MIGVYDSKSQETEIAHGPGGSAEIQGIARGYQHDAQIVELRANRQAVILRCELSDRASEFRNHRFHRDVIKMMPPWLDCSTVPQAWGGRSELWIGKHFSHAQTRPGRMYPAASDRGSGCLLVDVFALALEIPAGSWRRLARWYCRPPFSASILPFTATGSVRTRLLRRHRLRASRQSLSSSGRAGFWF